jgi:hypothetical protein
MSVSKKANSYAKRSSKFDNSLLGKRSIHCVDNNIGRLSLPRQIKGSANVEALPSSDYDWLEIEEAF